MDKNEIIKELSEILMLEDGFDVNKTIIEFDSLSSLMLVEFFDSNFKITVSKEEISSFNSINDVLNFISAKTLKQIK